MKKSSAFAAIAATIVAVLATAVPALAGAHYLTYTGSTEQASDNGAHYLTYTGSTEQTVSSAVRSYAGANEAAMLRGKALNAKYGNEWTRMPAQQFTALVNMFGTDVTQLSPQQLRTLVAQRGTPSSSDSFGWGSAGIGAAAALGLALVAAALRRIRQTPALAA
jgi:hypothetical protein